MTFFTDPQTGEKVCPECRSGVESMESGVVPNSGAEIVTCDCGWWNYL